MSVLGLSPSVSILDELSEKDLQHACAQLRDEWGRQIEKQMIDILMRGAKVTLSFDPEIETLYGFYLWGPVLRTKLTFVTSGGSEAVLKGSFAERDRYLAKLKRAERGYKRARTHRRRRYWANCFRRLARRYDTLFT